MGNRKLYRKRPDFHSTAVQLDLDFDGFEFQKWGGKQKCKRGDWLVNSNGETYTITKEYFSNFYQIVSPGVYKKIGGIWAEVATGSGSVKTEEGLTEYIAGDYLVYDRQEGGEGYAIKKPIFERMYEEIDAGLALTAEQQSYINDRIQPKVDEYNTKAIRNRKLFYFWQAIAIVSAALVPVFTGFIKDGDSELKWLVAILGGTSAVVAGLLSLFKFQENWIRYRSTHQDLDSHLSQFKIGVGIYGDRKYAFAQLAENCESILKAEIGQWAESRKKEKDEED